ncbi:MAG: hypothetical protein ABGX16_11570 [Pirellulales bacterium]
MIITFGKHKGKFLEDIPDSYLLWCLGNIPDLQPTLRQAIRQRLSVEDVPRFQSTDLSVVRVLESWYRQLAREFHPDLRGSHDAMLAVNRARDLLVEMTEAAQ